MARQARIKSMTGIYHVMLKGIDSRNIFMDDEDKMYFMENLKRAKERGEFKLYAYERTQGDGSIVHFAGWKTWRNLNGKIFASGSGFQLLSVSNGTQGDGSIVHFSG